MLSPDAWSEALICPDGMLHAASSRMNCTAVTTTCYQPTTAQAPRPCPAKEKEHLGCACDTAACAGVCRHVTPRDPEARCMYYAGSNHPHGSPNQPADGTPPNSRGK